MYGKASIVGVTAGSGALAHTGFGVSWYLVSAVLLLVGGLLLVRWTRRRAAATR
jgi:LPXTG-motif cell wall-anchored protein